MDPRQHHVGRESRRRHQVGRETEAIGADHGVGMHDHPVADRAAVADAHAGMEHALCADRDVGANRNLRHDRRSRADAAARSHHRIGADADPRAQCGVGCDNGRRMNAFFPGRSVVEQRRQPGEGQPRFIGGDDSPEGTGRNRMLGRNHHRLRLAMRQRRNGIRADRKRKIRRPFGPRGMHEAVDLDCAVAVEPARKRLCDVFGPHEF